MMEASSVDSIATFQSDSAAAEKSKIANLLLPSILILAKGKSDCELWIFFSLFSA